MPILQSIDYNTKTKAEETSWGWAVQGSVSTKQACWDWVDSKLDYCIGLTVKLIVLKSYYL